MNSTLIQQDLFGSLCYKKNHKWLNQEGVKFFYLVCLDSDKQALKSTFANLANYQKNNFKLTLNNYLKENRFYNSRINPLGLVLSFYTYISKDNLDETSKEILNLDMALFLLNYDNANIFYLDIKHAGELFENGNGCYKIFVNTNNIVVEYIKTYKNINNLFAKYIT